MDSGTAIISAITDETTVPYINGSAPNCPLIGSQVRLVKKSNPNSRIESIEFDAIATIIEVTMTSIRTALKNRVPRKIASPRLPVGESARRQFHDWGRPLDEEATLGRVDIRVSELGS